jgi:hypothetical protein
MIFSKGDFMKVKCLKFNTYYDDTEYIERCINSELEGKEVIDIKISSSHYENEDEMFLFVTILYK